MWSDLSEVPVVFLPGTLCDARVFAALCGHLPADRIIHADLTADMSVQAAAYRLLSVLPQRFVAVGFSLGAIVALELAAVAPERVGAMCLIAGNARDVPTANHAARRAAVCDIDPVKLVNRDLWPHYVHPSRLDDKDLRCLVSAMALACEDGTAERQTEIALSRVDSRPRLGEMHMPALILSGADDVIAPPEMHEELLQGLPNAQWKEIAHAGHFVLLENPAACSTAFSSWLRRLETSAGQF